MKKLTILAVAALLLTGTILIDCGFSEDSIEVSGVINCDRCRSPKGKIYIFAFNNLGFSRDSLIAQAAISSPGQYSIRVPVGSKDVYLLALYDAKGTSSTEEMEPSMTGTRKITIASDDISGIDITLSLKSGFTPDNAKAYYNNGKALFEAGKLDEATTEYKKAIESNQNYIEAYEGLRKVYLGKGLSDEAAKINNELIETRRRVEEMLSAVVRRDLEKESAKAEPNFTRLYLGFVTLYFGHGLIDEGMEWLSKAIETDPNVVDEALRSEVSEAEPYYYVGEAYRRRGELGKALFYWGKGLQLEPGNERIKKAMMEAEQK